MAKVSLSDKAPTSEPISFDFGGDAQFTLSASGRKNSEKFYETNDRAVLDNVRAHPWLRVDAEAVEPFVAAFHEQLAPKDDHLSALGATVDFNDPEVARAAEEAKLGVAVEPVAIDAGLDQNEVVKDGPVAKTLAAAEEETE
jgi:hypothetical protein